MVWRIIDPWLGRVSLLRDGGMSLTTRRVPRGEKRLEVIRVVRNPFRVGIVPGKTVGVRRSISFGIRVIPSASLSVP